MIKPALLLAEDEESLGMIIAESLETRGISVTHVRDGAEALHALRTKTYDIAVLDVMMPRLDGFSVVKKIRQEFFHLPVLFLTGKTMPRDVVEGFESGANDYLKKPFAMEELEVRIKALLNRISPAKSEVGNVVRIGAYTLDSHKQQLIFQDPVQKQNPIQQLTARETEILKLLYQYNQSVLEKKFVLTTVWGADTLFAARTLDVFITRLRKYLSQDPNIRIINIRGVGYRLVW